ncbi:MAG: FGGY-family carbohydrate kinase [Bacteroidota bacterium]
MGGGAKSPVWRQILADVLGLTLEIPAADEGPAYGAALLAAVGAGVFGSVREAAEACVRVQSVVEPDPDHVRSYDEAYAVYRQLYPALRPVFPAIARLAAQCKGQ